MFQSDWLILRILHQSFEIERPKGHWSEGVHLYQLSLRPLFCLFLSGDFTQVLLHLAHSISKFHISLTYFIILVETRLGISHIKSSLNPLTCLRVPTSAGKPGKSQKKVPCMEKSWNLKKN